jgi:hypothetical protein
MLRLPGFGYSIIRFIDDILILAPTRCRRRSVWRNIRTLLGYHFSLAGLTVAKQTLSNFIEKISQLLEDPRGWQLRRSQKSDPAWGIASLGFFRITPSTAVLGSRAHVTIMRH